MSDLRAIMDDILALHVEEDEIKEARKGHYADAQEAGFDKAALGLAIRTIRARRKQETPAALEKQSKADQYVEQYDASHVHVRAHAKSNTPSVTQQAVQSEAASGASPEQGSAYRAGGPGVHHRAAHADQFVTDASAAEGRMHRPADSALAPEDA